MAPTRTRRSFPALSIVRRIRDVERPTLAWPAMHVRLLSIWRSLTASFWFVPGLMSAGSAVLSLIMIAADEAWQASKADAVWFVWTGGAEGAREVLSAIASSTIGIAGVTFSILVVALAQASSQFGPRVLRSFMRDTGNQIALGTFIATFLYCVLVLRTVSGANGSEFVPDLSVSLGIVLGVCSVAVLIYFLHHAAISIQAPHIVTAIAEELDGIIEGQRVHEADAQGHTGGSAPVPDLGEPSRSIPAPASGYLEAIDFDTLIDCSRKHDLVLRLRHRAGEFVYGTSCCAPARRIGWTMRWRAPWPRGSRSSRRSCRPRRSTSACCSWWRSRCVRCRRR